MTIHFNDLVENLTDVGVPYGRVELPARAGAYRNFGKRLLDTTIVLFSAIVTLPVVLILAALVALDGSSPFYWQERVGRRGATFRMMKLRSMVPNADRLLEAYLASNPEAKAEWESTQKLKRDPRITRVGRLIRKTSLDELPQLWNVLKGDMSIVGPRPMMTSQRSLYPGVAYYALRPGITGPWQVSERNESEFSKRAIFDANYERDLSFRVDASIIFRTFAVVFRGTGY
ncbi:MAG: sugar transferase [Paracoccaceae bacterium]